MNQPSLTTALCHSTTDRVVLRGHDLVGQVMGQMSFAETLYLLITGRRPSAGQVRVLDAVLVTLMDHGMTPQAVAARLTYLAAPESLQGAIAAGLLGVGGRFAGTMEQAAVFIERIAAVANPAGAEAVAEAIVTDHSDRRVSLPGFGHPLHRPDDPRSPRLFAIAAEAGVEGRYVAALQLLSRVADRVFGRHLTINATGAIAAVLMEIDIPAAIMRGIAVVSRAGGLVAQLNEERENRMAGDLLKLVETAVSYSGD
jgi:citrate synthase